MGTSKQNEGPRISLVPSWADDPAPAAAAAAVAAPTATLAPPVTAAPGAPDVLGSGVFEGARRAFTDFAKSGSRSALERAAGRYVREGTGGARRATRRMGAARPTGGRVLGFLADVARNGAAAALSTFNLQGLAAQPAATVMTALVDFLCPAGGSIEEGIARSGMLQAIDDMAQAGLTSFNTLTPAQLVEFFVSYITRTIETKMFNDIGARGISLPEDVQAVNDLQDLLHSFVSGQVRDAVVDTVGDVTGLDPAAMGATVDRVYEAAFDVLEALVEP